MTRVIIVKVRVTSGVRVCARRYCPIFKPAAGSTRLGTRITDAMIKQQISLRVVVVGLALSLSACTNPYDPVQRTIGGGLIGAGSGAAIGPRRAADTVRPSARPSVERWAALSLH